MGMIPCLAARRSILAAGLMLPFVPRLLAATPNPTSLHGTSPLSVVVRSPFICNGVAVARDDTIFVGMPRFPGMEKTWSLARVDADGTPHAFPGGAWNEWQPGQDGTSAFVNVNAIHIFADNTLWAIDQGAPPGGAPVPGAQKLVQFDTTTGKVLQILRFSPEILPEGAAFNDLRIHNGLLFLTDSGIGGLVIHNLRTGKTVRRLSGHPVTRNIASRPQLGAGQRILADGLGARPQVQSDDIEIDPSGTWFYFSVPAGPLKRVRIADLLNPALSDADLAARVEEHMNIPSIGGTCMDTLGNIYLSDVEKQQISVHAPDGRSAVLVQDPVLVSPDGLFIDRHRRIYVPSPQIERLPGNNDGKNEAKGPFLVLAMPLPQQVGGIRLGSAFDI